MFDDRPRFAEFMSWFPKCQAIIPYLQGQDVLVEQVLKKLQAEAEQYPERHRQLAAIRYYLHCMLWDVVTLWNSSAKGVTNYKSLLDQLERWRKPQERICLVTFNYDTMLEAALPAVGFHIRKLSDYVSSETYKVIKLHGSVNWAREVDTPIENLKSKDRMQVAHELIDRAADLNISHRYRIVNERPISILNQSVLFPALAIPLERKPDFECPPEQLETLHACITQVTKLLVIGWRATEHRFLDLLAKYLPRQLAVMVVASGRDKTSEPIRNLQQAGIKADFLPAHGGFTDVIVRREADEFLRS